MDPVLIGLVVIFVIMFGLFFVGFCRRHSLAPEPRAFNGRNTAAYSGRE